MNLSKAVPRGERARIEELVARESAAVRRAFRAFLDFARSDTVRRQVREALEFGGVEEALSVIDAHVLRMSGVLDQVFRRSGASEVSALVRQVRPAVALSFDPGDPVAAALMRSNKLEFVAEFTRAQREATRAALVEALQSGTGPVQTARAFRDSIGLTEVQRQAVANYRRLLETGDAAALERILRDRRFDPSVERAMGGGEPLGAKKINTMVERYRMRYLQYRAETIARTETVRVVSSARQEALKQILDKVGMPKNRVKRTWRSTRDARVRDTHDAMDGQQRGLDEPFRSPSGARLRYPGDPSAPAEEVINCRCVVVHEILPPVKRT